MIILIRRKRNVKDVSRMHRYNHYDDLPSRLVTKEDFEDVLNYFLDGQYKMEVKHINGLAHLQIKNISSSLHTFNEAKTYIESYKIIGVNTKYY